MNSYYFRFRSLDDLTIRKKDKKKLPVYTYLADPITIFELQNPSYDVLEQHKIRRSPDREALEL